MGLFPGGYVSNDPCDLSGRAVYLPFLKAISLKNLPLPGSESLRLPVTWLYFSNQADFPQSDDCSQVKKKRSWMRFTLEFRLLRL